MYGSLRDAAFSSLLDLAMKGPIPCGALWLGACGCGSGLIDYWNGLRQNGVDGDFGEGFHCGHRGYEDVLERSCEGDSDQYFVRYFVRPGAGIFRCSGDCGKTAPLAGGGYVVDFSYLREGCGGWSGDD